ncbi:MAG: sodium/proton-translocating pyrophosphatase, partial [Planctomycetales bacterium]|nr:sodium/proton-translocating pyrophosphatase [Planctomycetales bacterium]
MEPAAAGATGDAEAGDADSSAERANRKDSKYILIWFVAFVGAIIALIQAFLFFKSMMAADEGNERMVEIAGYVRAGANAYLTQQYKVVAVFFVVIFGLLAWMAFSLHVQSRWVPFAFLTGGFFSGLAGWFGMKTATWASSRTSAGAQRSLNQGLQVAFRSGAVMGLTVVGLGLLDITVWFAVLFWVADLGLIEITVTMLCFGMGASAQALFARVGGGIFTKAADVGADLVGKVEQGIPEDDPRNPATIADNVGDNVGDVAGMGADLYESYVGSILAAIALSWSAALALNKNPFGFAMAPVAIAAFGIILSVFSTRFVKTDEGATLHQLLGSLHKGVNVASISVGVFALPICFLAFREMGFFMWLAVVTGLGAGLVIAWGSERYTAYDYEPTQGIAKQSVTGPATVIIAGVAEGFYSVWVPIVVVGSSILLAFGLCTGWDYTSPHLYAMGLYGVAIAAVGMLSTLGITLATDAYGPIADNAGGNAEMSHQDPEVRRRTDA